MYLHRQGWETPRRGLAGVRESDRQQPAVVGPCCRGSSGAGAGGGCRGDGKVLPDEAVKETCHEEGREDGDEEQGWQGLLRNSQ